MADAAFIEKAPRLEPSQDFALLRAHGLTHIEKLAHAIWTDYNVHDPGVTLLELLCYAVTDLGYRTGYDVSDLLTENVKGRPVNRANFHTARQALACGPVTFDDLRKLLIDIPGVKNAWIEKHSGVQYRVDTANRALAERPDNPNDDDPDIVTVSGLYDVFIEYEERVGSESTSAHLGASAKAAGRRFVDPANRGAIFHAARPLTLDAVTVYPEAEGKVTVMLADGAGTVLASREVKVRGAGEANRIPLGFNVPIGSDYRLDVQSEVKLCEVSSSEAAHRFSIPDVMSIVQGGGPGGGARRASVLHRWEITFPSSAQSSGAPRISVVVKPREAGERSPIEPQDKGVAFDALRDLLLESVDVYAAADGEVTVRLLDAAGKPVLDASGRPVERAAVSVRGGGDAITIGLGFALEHGRSYRLDAKGTTVRLLRTPRCQFPYEVPNVIRLTGGFPSAGALYFFYAWKVSYEAAPPASALSRTDVRARVRDCLFSERNLCEDVVRICELDKEEIGICADIEVRPGADLDELLAEILYRVECHISPPVRFYTLGEMLAKGRSTSEIFEGPRLQHGFIDDEEFRKIVRRCELRVSDIVNLLMEADLPDLVAIRNIRLLSYIGNDLRLQAPWVLPLATPWGQPLVNERFRVPAFSLEHSKVVFYRNDLPYYANRERVKSLLEKKRAAMARPELRGEELDVAVPVGEYRDPARYYPAQNDLPPAYCVGQVKVPDSASPLRKAQAKQLKAYLLFFEQLLANYLSQLANVRTLFSWNADPIRSYFSQPIEGIVDLPDLYVDGVPTRSKLDEIAETPEAAAKRRARFLDHLIARFCEDFTEYSLLMYSLDKSRSRAIEDRRLFLEDYPASSAARGQACDYRVPSWPENLSGYQHRVYRLLGIRDLTRHDLACRDIEIVEPPAGSSDYYFVVKDESGAPIFKSITCESRTSIDMVLDLAFTIGGDPDNYLEAESGGGWNLVRRCPDRAANAVIGSTTSADVATRNAVRDCFATYAVSEGFHAIEHVLLRPRTHGNEKQEPDTDKPTSWLPIHLNVGDQCLCPEARDPYSFRLTVLLPAWSRRFRDLRFRRLVEETLRREAPAHVFVKICWISHDQMKQVDAAYSEWAGQLAALEPRLGLCEVAADGKVARSRSGAVPLPAATTDDETYSGALRALIAVLRGLVTVYPVARLHDCKDASGDEPQVSLNNTSLGTF